MNAHQGQAAPASGSNDIPTFDELAADPEIAALLDFEPVPRQVPRPNGWTPERQREFIARLAYFGSPKLAADSMNKNVSGVSALYKQKGTDSFRAAWDAAEALGVSRRPPDMGTVFLGAPPGMSQRRAGNRLAEPGPRDCNGHLPAPGQVMNERGEWEDEASYLRRAEDAKDSIAMKLLRIRRIFLQEISDDPAKRAAFEILTELPIDWDLARERQPQPDEPYNITNQRQPDMVLMAESGWSFGECGYGPDKKAEMRAAIDAWRAERGMPAVEWEGGQHRV